MPKDVLELINYIDSAINKTNQFDNFSPEMSERVLDNRIITLEGYLRFIERETMPTLEKLIDQFEEVNNG